LEAVFTINIFLPLKDAKSMVPPSSLSTLKLWMGVGFILAFMVDTSPFEVATGCVVWLLQANKMALVTINLIMFFLC
jgi:hypothetical protein